MSKSLVPESAYRERGIVLHTLKYSDHKLIVHMLTKKFGRKNYITAISSSLRKNIFQPMSVLDFQAIQSRRELDKLTQADLGLPLHNLFFDISKCTISMFISELLYRVLREPLDDERVYIFVEDSLVVLNGMDRGVGNFHIWFLVHFAYYMGYDFPSQYSEGDWLDIKKGYYTPYAPLHQLRISPFFCNLISRFKSLPLSRVSEVEMSRSVRVDLLRGLVDYYSFHCDNFSSVKSIDILTQVF